MSWRKQESGAEMHLRAVELGLRAHRQRKAVAFERRLTVLLCGLAPDRNVCLKVVQLDDAKLAARAENSLKPQPTGEH